MASSARSFLIPRVRIRSINRFLVRIEVIPIPSRFRSFRSGIFELDWTGSRVYRNLPDTEPVTVRLPCETRILMIKRRIDSTLWKLKV